MNKIVFLFGLFFSSEICAQLLHDPFLLGNKGLFFNTHLSYSTSSKYWEAQSLRSNLDFGKITKFKPESSLSLGLGSNFNLGAKLAYGFSNSIGATSIKQKSFQDFTLFTKFGISNSESPLIFLIYGSYTAPLGAYDTQNQLLAIGKGNTTYKGGLHLGLKSESGIYVSASGHYSRNNHLKTNLPYILDQEISNLAMVEIPDAIQTAIFAGKKTDASRFSIYAKYGWALSGFDIIQDAIPYVNHRSKNLNAGLEGLLTNEKIGLSYGVDYTISGRNVPKTLEFNLGLVFQLNGSTKRFEY
jgi:hypothetical protein